LQVAKLDGCRLCFKDGGGFGQLGRGLELSFGVDDFCATLAFGLRQPRMARCIVSGISTCLTSTFVTLIP